MERRIKISRLYLANRSSKTPALFLVQKGPLTGRETDIRPGNPEEDRILCKKERTYRIVPSSYHKAISMNQGAREGMDVTYSTTSLS
jgi:hypothetical protein